MESCRKSLVLERCDDSAALVGEIAPSWLIAAVARDPALNPPVATEMRNRTSFCCVRIITPRLIEIRRCGQFSACSASKNLMSGGCVSDCDEGQHQG